MSKNRKLLFFICAFLLIISFQNTIRAQQKSDWDVKHSDAVIKAAEARKQLIEAEIKQSADHDWAGEYHYGDGLGVNVSLTLAPAAGFVFSWYGCMGLYDLNYGNVEYADGILRLKFEQANNREGFQGIAPEFYLVKWDERHYLIPTDKMIDFCNNVNDGSEPERSVGSSYLLRSSDRNKSVKGKPALPSQYQDYLLKKPLNTSVTAIEGSKVKLDKDSNFQAKLTHATFDVGRAEGVRKGMAFHASRSAYNATAYVLVEHEHSCEVVIEQFGSEEYCPTPELNWKFSTVYVY